MCTSYDQVNNLPSLGGTIVRLEHRPWNWPIAAMGDAIDQRLKYPVTQSTDRFVDR